MPEPRLQDHQPVPKQEQVPTPQPDPCPPPKPKEQPKNTQPCRQQPPLQNNHITSFFRQLLPKQLETADLLIILLLLLMAGDCEEDRNNALLTMALYFLM